MSNHVDERVVEMQFKNREFEKNISTSINSINDLKKSLDFKEAGRNIQKIEKAANGISFDGVKNQANTIIENISAKAIAKAEVIRRVVNSVIDSGERLLRSMSADQISEGWNKFQAQTTSIGTLISQGFSMDEVQDEMKKLQWFADETSYSLTDMTENISKFTAQGKGMAESRVAMEGIALIAAKAGQNAQTASTAMYQLSQALGRTMQKMDWQQGFINRNMDSKELRQAALDAGVAFGTLADNLDGTYTTMEGLTIDASNFLDTLTEGAWMTADVQMELYRTYGAAVDDIYQYTEDFGGLASQAIEALDGQVDAFGLAAFKAGQESRTFRDSIEATKDAVSSSWARVYEAVVGNYEEQKVLWSDLTERLWTYIAGPVSALADRFEEWKELGGRTSLFSGIQYALEALDRIIEAVTEGFRRIFPKKTADELVGATRNFEAFMQALQPGPKLLNAISTSVALLMVPVKMAVATIKGALRLISLIAAGAIYLASNLRALTAVLWQTVSGSERLHDICAKLEERFGRLKIFISNAKDALKNLVENFDGAQSIGEFARRIVDGFKTIGPDIIESGKDIVLGLIKGIWTGAQNLYNTAVSVAREFLAGFNKEMEIHSPSKVMIAEGLFIIAGLVTGILLGLSNLKESGKTVGQALVESFEQFTNSKFVQTVKTFFKNITDRVNETFPQLKQAFDSIKAAFNAFFNVFISSEESTWEERFEKFKQNLNSGRLIALGLGIAVISIGLAIGKVINSFLPMFKGLTRLIDGVRKAVESLTGVFDTVSKSLKKFSSAVALRSFAVSVAILVGALAILATFPAGKAEAAAKSLMFIGLALAGAMAVFLILFSDKVLGGEAMQKEIDAFSKLLLKLAAVFAVVAIVVKVMSKVPLESLDAVAAMAAVLIGLGILAKVIASINVDEKDFQKIARAFIPMSTAMLILCVALKAILKMLPEMDWKAAAAGFGTILTLIALLGAMAIALSDAGNKPFAAAVALNLMVIALLGMLAVIRRLGEIKMEPEKLVKALLLWLPGLFALLYGLSMILQECGDAALKAGAGMLMMIASLELVIGAIRRAANMKTDKTILQLIAISAIAAGLLILCTRLGKVETKATKGALGMAALLLAISVSMAILSSDSIKIGKAFLGAVGMAAVILAVAVAFDALADCGKVTGAIIAFTVMIVMITTSLAVLQIWDAVEILQRARSLALVIGAIAIALAAASAIDKGVSIAGLIVATLALGGLLAAISYFPEPKFDWTQLAAIAGGLSVVMLAMAGAAKIVDSAIAGTIGMVILSGALLVACLGFSMIMSAVDPSIAGGQLLMIALAISATVAVFGLMALVIQDAILGVALLAVIAVTLVGVAFSFKMVLEALGPRAATDLLIVAGAMAGAILVLGGVSLLLGALIAVAGPGALVIAILAAALIGVGFAFKLFANAGLVFAQAMSAITAAMPGFSAAVTMGIVSVTKAVTIGAKELAKQGFILMYSAGYNVIAGLLGGIKDGLKSVLGIGETMGGSLFSGFCDFLGIHSPALKMIWAAGQCISGLVKGTKSKKDVLTDIGEFMGDTSLGGLLSKLPDFTAAGEAAGLNWGTGLQGAIDGIMGKLGFGGFDQAEMDKLTAKYESAVKYQQIAEEAFANGEISLGDRTTAQRVAKEAERAMNDYAEQHHTTSILDNLLGDFNLEEKMDELTSGLGEGLSAGGGGGGAAAKEVEDLTVNTYELDKVVAKVDKDLKKKDATLKKDANVIDKAKKATLAFGASLVDLSQEFESNEALIQQISDAVLKYKDNVDQTVKSQIDLFDGFDAGAAPSVNAMVKGFDAISKGIEEFQSNLEAAASKGYAQEVLQHLVDLGPEAGYGWARTLANATDEEVAKVNEAFARAQKWRSEAADEITSTMIQANYADATDIYSMLGENAGDAYAQGLLDMFGTVKQTNEDFGLASANALKETLGIHSPSTVYMGMGENSGIGYFQGLTNSLDEMLPKFDAYANRELVPKLSEVLQRAMTKAREMIQNGISNDLVLSLRVDDNAAIDTLAALRDTMNSFNLGVGQSYDQALAATEGAKFRGTANTVRDDEDRAPTKVTNLNYTQNNYSPKALPAIDIYRRTNRSLKTGLEAVK